MQVWLQKKRKKNLNSIFDGALVCAVFRTGSWRLLWPPPCVNSLPMGTVLVTPARTSSPPVVVHSNVAVEKQKRNESTMGKITNSPLPIHVHVSRTISYLWKHAPQMRVWCECVTPRSSLLIFTKNAWTYKQVHIWTWTLIKQCSVFLLLLAKPYFGL